MSNRTAFHWTPKVKPVVKGNSRTKRAGGVPREVETIEELPTPDKSENDQKIYKTIRLRNGLTALLISDPTQTAKAACALSVNVGSFSDPQEIQGLAHFVEHMVFMGSEKYPVENQFDQYVVGSAGEHNAVTGNEMTTFHFEIVPKKLVGAIHMMTQFFISPLMLKEAMQREREAVDSEFADNMLTEDYRVDQILTCMFPPGHPYSNFAGGNLNSLRNALDSDDDLHCVAHKFRAQHYSANRMTVAVQAKMDITSLEAIVADNFGPIPSSATQPDDLSRFAYSADTVPPEFRSLYYVKPTSDACEVFLAWCLRSLLSKYESKPLHYIGFLFRYEGKGSLLSYLKKKVWALNIHVENSDQTFGNSSINTFFFMTIQLTKDGLEHLDEVIEAVFSYLNMLRLVGPNERIFNEMKSLADNKFYFIYSPRPYDYVKNLAMKMHIYPPEHYITGDRLYFKYNPTGIKQVMDSLRADNVNIRVLSNQHNHPIDYDMEVEWRDIKYRREAIPQEWLKRWMNVAAYPEFQLPEKNVYITNDFSVSPLPAPYVNTAERLGLDLEDSSLHDIWINTVGQRRLVKKFREDSFSATVSRFRLCLLDLWNDVVRQDLQDEVYRASLADLWHSISIQNGRVKLHIRGYSQHLHLLVDSTTSSMSNASEALTPKMFEAVREVRARTYHNNLINPSDLSEIVLTEVLQKPYISPRDKAVWINKVTLKDLKDFGRLLLTEMYMQVLIQGNTPWYQAIDIAEKVHRDLNWVGLTEDKQPEFKIRQLPLGERRVRLLSLNEFSTSSVVTNYYQGEVYTAKDSAILTHISAMMEEQLFNTLRTKEQLGYHVFSEERSTLGVHGFSISVHTHVDKHSVQHVEQRIDAFLDKYLRNIQRIPRNPCKPDDTIFKIVQKDDSLDAESDANWAEIINREYNFERRFQLFEADNALKMTDIIAWIKNYFASSNNSTFRKLSVQIVGHKESNDSTNNSGEPGPLQMTDYKLTYLKREPGEKSSEYSYITNIQNFTKNLARIKVPKIQLT